uniref:Uncharacterized protein n=1 Tax=Ananas comosus var. bracteatus TaxID=296719 RepID=A0A6V7NQC7_ANACO|nr:unnamed protein product [Ananas comosus var. bracteatus]
MASSDDRSALTRSLTSRYSEWIAEALDELPECFLITDPAIPGHPIVFASRGFLAMEWYAMDEVLGRNGRIFQVPAMERRSVMEIRKAVREEWTVQISLLNYCRDGAPHWILFHMCPVFEAAGSGRVVHFLAAQVPVPPRSRARSRSRWCGGATGMMLRACRNELLMDEDLGCSRAEESFVDEGLGCSHAEKSFVEMRSGGVEAEEPPVATNCEKEKAVNAANSITSLLALDDSILDADQVENLIKFCPTKEEMDLLKGYDGVMVIKKTWGNLMKVPRVESKLRVLSFMIQFRSQVGELKNSLNAINSASEEVRSSVKLKRIMQTILSLGNARDLSNKQDLTFAFQECLARAFHFSFS